MEAAREGKFTVNAPRCGICRHWDNSAGPPDLASECAKGWSSFNGIANLEEFQGLTVPMHVCIDDAGRVGVDFEAR